MNNVIEAAKQYEEQKSVVRESIRKCEIALEDGTIDSTVAQLRRDVNLLGAYADYLYVESNKPQTYKYTYLHARQFGIGCQPMDGFVEVNEDPNYRYMTITYDRPLTDKEVYDYELKAI